MRNPSWPNDIAALHSKFGVNAAVNKMDVATLAALKHFRLRFLEEELAEAYSAETADDFVDAMIDLCVVAIGTLDAFGVDAQKAWNRVHFANMAKEVGIKESRPNPLKLPDLIKPPEWNPPNHSDNVGYLAKIFLPTTEENDDEQ